MGAGSAGCGIAEMLIQQMVFEGLTDEQARKQVFMIDRFGLKPKAWKVYDFQQKLQQKMLTSDWTFSGDYASLLTLCTARSQTYLLVSGQPACSLNKLSVP